MKALANLKAIGFVATALAASGCVSKVDLPRPEALESPSAFKNEESTAGSGSVSVAEGWWARFSDSRLSELIAAAEANAPSLEAAVLQMEQARALARLEGADLAPQLDLLGSATRSRQSGTTGTVVSPGATRNRFFAALQLDWEIDPWGRVRHLREARVFEAEAASQAYGYALVLLRSQVAQTYFRLREMDRRIGILEATIEVRREAMGLVEIRLESGLSDELEMSQARTEYASALADLERSRGVRDTLENALATLTGAFASNFDLDFEGEYEALAVATPRAVASEALQRRPDIAEALQLVKAASERVGAQVAEFYPSLSLGGDFGYSSSETSSWFEDPSRLWSFGPSLNLPLFQGRARDERFELAKIEYAQLFSAYRGHLLRAVEEVESSLATLRQLEREQEALQQAARYSANAAELARQRYESGLVSYLEVVDTERAALTAALRLSQVEMERLGRLAQLYAELGGGWEGSVSQ